MKPRRLIAWAGSLVVTTCAGAWTFGSLVGGFGPLLPPRPQPLQPGPGPQRVASEPSSANVFRPGNSAHSAVDGIVPVSLSGPQITAAPLLVPVRITQREPGPARVVQRAPAARGSSAGETTSRRSSPATLEPAATPDPPATPGSAATPALAGIAGSDAVRHWLRAALARGTTSDHETTHQARMGTTKAAGTGSISTGVGRGQARSKPGG